MGNFRPRTIVEYFAILRRRKWLVLLYTAGVAFAAFTLTNAIPSVYESQSVLGISERAGKDPEARSSRISAARQRAISTANLEALIDRQHLRGMTESVDGAVQRLRREIKIETTASDSQPPVPVAVYVSYRGTNPKLAQQVVTDIVWTLNRTNEILTKRAALEAEWLSSQIARLEKQLTSLNKGGPATSFPGFAGDPEAVRIALLSTIESLNDKQYALEQQINEQERQIREQRRIAATSPKDSPYGALLLRKAELAAQLREYAPQYTDKNPKVLQAKTQLSEIDRQLAALAEKNPLGSAGYETLSLERDLVRQQTELELARREVGRKKTELDALSRAYGFSFRNPKRSRAESLVTYDPVGTRYQSLLEQRDQMQRAGISASWEPPLFDVIDPPNLPQQPVGPNRLKLWAFALAIGLGAGLLILVIAEGGKLFFIQDRNDVDYFLGLPVLTVIPETLSPAERSLKWRKLLASKFSVVLLAAAMPAMALAIRHHDFFQRVVSR